MGHLLISFLLLLFTLYYNKAFPSNLKIVATIKPIHSLVASVTDGILKPELLMYKVQSEHNYMLRPSDASKLESSNIIFYIDDSLEIFIKNFAKKNKKLIQLSTGIDLLPTRPHSFTKKINYIQDEKDLHIWLSPKNVKNMILFINSILSDIDKENAHQYNMNAIKAIRKIDKEVEKITKELNECKNQKYIVTHDSYQYFEKYFGLTSPIAILCMEEDSYIGMKSLMKLKKIIQKENIKCIFTHPKENNIKSIFFSNNSDIKIVTLDPIESNTEPGKDAYLVMLNNIAKNFKSCFFE